MQIFSRLSSVLFTSLMLVSCGGGGNPATDPEGGSVDIELGGDDVVVEQGGNYRCAVNTSTISSFAPSATTNLPDFSKRTGINLARYFYYITTDDNDAEIERRNTYIQRYEKHYVFGQASGYEITEFDAVTVQSLLNSWFYIGNDYDASNPISPNSVFDNDTPRYEFSPADFTSRTGGMLLDTMVHFADLGDTVSYTNSHALGSERKSSCVINDNFIPANLTRDYGDVIALECTSYLLSDPNPTSGNQFFSGSKSKLYLAKDIGIVADLTDAYQTTLNNTQETNRRCLQVYSELESTQIVPRAYTPDLGNISL